MNFSSVGYDGSIFSDFYVTKCPNLPGWFIYGRNSQKYGVSADGTGAYVMLCGYRVEKRHRHYNGKVRHGWRTKAEAEAKLADHLANYPSLATA